MKTSCLSLFVLLCLGLRSLSCFQVFRLVLRFFVRFGFLLLVCLGM